MNESPKKATDVELVRDARQGGVAAFEALTARHFPMVYAMAYARLGTREAAEDLAQEVFLLATLHLGALTDPARFAAWLGRIARNEAGMWRRRSQSASRLVRLVPLDDLPAEPAAPASQEARTVLEADEETRALHEALFRLPEELREVVVLHYFEDLSKAEIAERLEVHPATVGRQIEKALKAMKRTLEPILRRAAPAFRHSGKAAARTTLLVGAVAAMSAPAKAALLAEAGASVAFIAAAGATAGVASTATGWHTILTGGFIVSIKTQIVAVLIAFAIIVGVTYHQMAQTPPVPKGTAKPAAEVAQAPAPLAQNPTGSALDSFYALYRLDDGEVLRHVAPPFIPERAIYYRAQDPSQARAANKPPDRFRFKWENGLLKRDRSTWANGGLPLLLSDALEGGMSDLRFHELEGPKDLLGIDVPGDWIVREGTSREDLLKALEGLLKKDLGRDIRFTKRQIEREIIVARGKYSFNPVPANGLAPNCVHFYVDTLESAGPGNRQGTLADLLDWTEDLIRRPVIDETESSEAGIGVPIPGTRPRRSAGSLQERTGLDFCSDAILLNAELQNVATPEAGKILDDKMRKFLDNLSKQTSLTFTVEKHIVDVWFVSDANAPAGLAGAPVAAPAAGPTIPATNQAVPAK